MNPMLQAFLSEAHDLLEAVSSCFLALEERPGDTEILNDLFRSVHTLKGSSGLFDIKPFTKALHVAEDVLDQVRDGKLVMTSERVDVFLEVFDQVSTWLDELETEDVLGPDAAAISNQLVQKMKHILAEASPVFTGETAPTADEGMSVCCSNKTGNIDEAECGGGRGGIPVWIDNVPDDVIARAFESCQDGARIIAVEYQPEEQCFYTGDDPLLTVLKSPGFLWMDVQSVKDWPSLAEFDPYTCCIHFYLICVADMAELQEHFIYIEDQVQLVSIEPDNLVKFQEQACGCESDIQLPKSCSQGEYQRDIAIRILETQREILSLPCDPEIWRGRLQSVSKVCKRLIKCFWRQEAVHVDEADEESIRCHSVDPLVNILSRILNSEEPLESPSIEPLQSKSVVDNSKARVASKAKTDLGPIRQKHRSNVLKVDHGRIDALMDLAGELVVAKNALPFLAKRAEEEFGLRDLGREIKRHYAVINRITEDLQSTVMQVSMIPVSTIFQRFPRMVRDLSRKLNKKIKLVIKGEDTEADKNVVESLAEPLVHLIRNSIDHGIELPEERKTANKDEHGEIRLQASYQNDQVVIEVSDDGRGIDPEVIKKKAYEKGIISEKKLDTISDHEAIQLVLAPGFSTAEAVSDLSGRGVGMDVVKNAVNQAGGSLNIESVRGRGTTVRLAMPLTMAVSRVMIIEVADQSFGVHIDLINETVRVNRDDIHQIKNQEAIVLRNEIIPICRLRHLLELGEDKEGKEDAILVVGVRGMRLGLVVDGFQEGVDVILKPLEGVMANFHLYAGTALLGDGRILLILDLEELLQCL